LALRLSSNLMFGVVRVFNHQYNFLYRQSWPSRSVLYSRSRIRGRCNHPFQGQTGSECHCRYYSARIVVE
jgi:hypothetical protein